MTTDAMTKAQAWLTDLIMARVFAMELSDDKRTWWALMPFIYTTAIIRGRVFEWYSDRWCFDDAETAKRCFSAWDGQGDPPDGWIKHWETNRCRPDGDPARETIGWEI